MSLEKKRKKIGIENYEIARRFFKWCIILFIIYGLIWFYFDTIIPEFEYFYYRCSLENYAIVDADVIEGRDVIIIYGRGGPVVTCRKNTVQYVINGVTYTGKTYAYPDVRELGKIKIAVKITDNTKIKRCIEYHWGDREKIRAQVEIISIVISIILYLLSNHVMCKKEKEYAREYNEKHPIKEKRSLDEQIVEKQLYILEHIPQCKVADNELKELTDGLASKWIKFNRGTLWMLSHYSGSQEMSDIFNLLPLIWEGEYFEYIEKLHEQGLLENYYVLAEQDEKYYCCCGESEWLYIYSKGTGITHTKYETIYDYIIEQTGLL